MLNVAPLIPHQGSALNPFGGLQSPQTPGWLFDAFTLLKTQFGTHKRCYDKVLWKAPPYGLFKVGSVYDTAT